MSQKFSLKWHDYHSNWTQSLSELRNDQESADVTLISDDKVKFSAHKVLLSSCSNIFNFILKNNTHTNPLLFLGGVSSVNLGFMLDYIYHGEVKIFQEQLDSFLESAQKLEIEGLLANGEDTEEDSKENKNTGQETHETNIGHLLQEQTQTQHQPPQEKKVVRMNDNFAINTRRQFSRTNADDRIDVSNLNNEEIEDKMKELYEKRDGVWNCLACDYTTSSNSGDIRKHVEIHLDGLCYTCNICSKEFRSSNILFAHKSRFHKQ